jgi:hypothetical protein
MSGSSSRRVRGPRTGVRAEPFANKQACRHISWRSRSYTALASAVGLSRLGNIDDPSVVRHPQLSSVASMYQNSCKMKSYFQMYRVAATSPRCNGPARKRLEPPRRLRRPAILRPAQTLRRGSGCSDQLPEARGHFRNTITSGSVDPAHNLNCTNLLDLDALLSYGDAVQYLDIKMLAAVKSCHGRKRSQSRPKSTARC